VPVGSAGFYYLDVTLEETFRRHLTRPQANEFSTEQTRSWYRPRDLLGTISERVISETSSLRDAVELIAADMGLVPTPKLDGVP